MFNRSSDSSTPHTGASWEKPPEAGKLLKTLSVSEEADFISGME